MSGLRAEVMITRTQVPTQPSGAFQLVLDFSEFGERGAMGYNIGQAGCSDVNLICKSMVTRSQFPRPGLTWSKQKSTLIKELYCRIAYATTCRHAWRDVPLSGALFLPVAGVGFKVFVYQVTAAQTSF